MNFPSPLTKLQIETKEGRRAVLLPINEQFRARNIFSDHEYSINPRYLPSGPITVVDIGANVGLFALYMAMNHCVGMIHCFEPASASIELLRQNTADLTNVHIHPYGLSNRSCGAHLLLHPKNSGENKVVMHNDAGAPTEEILLRDAAKAFSQLELTYIDVLKIDTEGCEIPVLASLGPRLEYVGVILLEYHSETHRRQIDRLLSRFKLFGARVERMDVGTLKYINRRLLPKAETVIPSDVADCCEAHTFGYVKKAD